MAQIIKQNGKKYLIVDDKAIPYEFTDKKGRPVIEVKSEKIKNKKGGTDIKVYIQTLKIIGKNKLIDKKELDNLKVNLKTIK